MSDIRFPRGIFILVKSRIGSLNYATKEDGREWMGGIHGVLMMPPGKRKIGETRGRTLLDLEIPGIELGPC